MCCIERPDTPMKYAPPSAADLASLTLPVLRRGTAETHSPPLRLRLPTPDDARGPAALRSPKPEGGHWVLRHLAEMNLKPENDRAPLALLEVGATRTHLVDCPWLDAEAIHPSSSHANIRRAGLMDLPSAPSRYDVIVHNKLHKCAQSARKEALRRCHALLRDCGHLFVSVPQSFVDGGAMAGLLHDLKQCGLRTLFQRWDVDTSFIICRRASVPTGADEHLCPLAGFLTSTTPFSPRPAFAGFNL